MNLISFEAARKKLYKIIDVCSGCSNTDIYEFSFGIFGNEHLTKAFLLNEGYSSSTIALAKHQFNKRNNRGNSDESLER